MLRQTLTKRQAIYAILILQFIPLFLLPPSSFSGKTQEWWLPVFLGIMAIIAVINLLVRSGVGAWPWYLIGFSQGFNIISRLMLLMPHATINQNGVQVINTLYVLLTLISVIWSGLILWYVELPEVKINYLRQKST